MILKYLRANWQYVGVIFLFLGISAVYFFPSIKGYTLQMGDITSWKGMSKELRDYRDRTGEEAVWTNTSFSGMPGYQISVYYNNPIKDIYDFLNELLGFPIMAITFAFLCFFIMCRAFNAGFYLAMIGALAYGMCTYHVLLMEAGHSSKMMAIAFIPGVIAGIRMLYRKDNVFFSFAVLALFVALELLVNHVQMTYYFFMFVVAMVIAEFYTSFKNKELRRFFIRTGLIAAAGLLGVIANFANYYHTYQFAKETMRGKPVLTIEADNTEEKSKNLSGGLDRDYIVQWCYGKEETYNLVVPNAKGDYRNLTKEFFEYVSKSAPRVYNFCAEQYQQSGGRLFRGYWGDQPFTGGPNYLGAITALFAIMYLIFVKTPLKWALLALSTLVIMLSWGKNLGGSVENMWLTNFFIDHVPMYNKFRAVSSILVVINLVSPLMMVLFIKHLMDHPDWAKENMKRLMIAGGSIAGIVLFFAFFPDFFEFTSTQESMTFTQLAQQFSQDPSVTNGVNPLEAEQVLIDFRQDAFSKDSYRTFGFMIGGLLLLFLMIRGQIKAKMALPLIAALILVDTWNVNKRFLSNEKNPQNKREYLYWEKLTGNQNTFTATEGDNTIYNLEAGKNPKIAAQVEQELQEARKEKRKSLTAKDVEDIKFEVLNLNTNYRVLNISDPFNSSQVSYFHKSSGGYSPAKLKRYQDMIDFYISKELSMLREPEKMKVLNMLNTRYYLYQGQLGFQNPYAYGNAWFVNDVKLVNNPDEAILAIADIDPKSTAIVNKEFEDLVKGHNFRKDSSASIMMTSYKPNEIVYKSSSPSEALAVFSEIYYEDGWKAFIDNNPVEHFRTDYILRGLVVPAGNHEIVFRFEPSMLKWSNIINMVGAIIILALFVYAIYDSIKRKKSEETADV